VLVVLAVSGCDEPPAVPTPTPAPTAQGLSLEQVMADFGVYDEPATAGDIAASRATLDFAADALELGDKDLFLGMLTRDLQRDFASADFTSADTAGLAGALRRATLAQSSGQYSIIYDTIADGLTFPIMLIKEDGTWKIDTL
jgi:hypothetical protein